MIGISIESRYIGPILHEHYGIFESLPKGVDDVYGATKLFINSIWHIIVGKASFSKSVAGPVKIAQMATRTAEVGHYEFPRIYGIAEHQSCGNEHSPLSGA